MNYRTNNCKDYKKIFRTLDLVSGSTKYERNINIINCHLGQRKLFYTEVEFLSILSKYYDLNDIIVVYIGAAGGHHLPLIFDMFPELEFILFDANPFKFDRKDYKVMIFNEFYTNETHQKIKNLNDKNKKIAFISDIRREPREEMIHEDMINQQHWLIQLDSIAYMLKFKLPYPIEGSNFLKEKGYKYLKGKMYIQLYAPNRSTEARLIKVRKPNEPFKFKLYDIRDYDEKFNYFNTELRNTCYKYKKSNELKYNLLGFDDSYESVCEYYLVYKYFKYHKKCKPSHIDVTRHLFKINTTLYKFNYSNPLICLINMHIKKFKQWAEKGIKIDKKKYLQKIEDIQNSLKQQIQCFKKGTLLQKKDYEEQIEIAESQLLEIEKIKNRNKLD